MGSSGAARLHEIRAPPQALAVIAVPCDGRARRPPPDDVVTRAAHVREERRVLGASRGYEVDDGGIVHAWGPKKGAQRTDLEYIPFFLNHYGLHIAPHGGTDVQRRSRPS